MYLFLFKQRLHAALRYFETKRSAKSLVLIGFLAAFALLIGIVYESFYYGFRYISRDPYFGEAITIYIVELFFLVSAILTYASALFFGVFAIFKEERDRLILASPSFGAKIALVLARMSLSSLWPLLSVIFPALVAFRQAFGLSLFGFALGTLSSALLVVAANLFAIVTLLLVSDALDAFDAFTRRRAALGALCFLILLLAAVWTRFTSLDLVSFFQARLIDATLPNIDPILAQFKVFPSHFSALVIFYGKLGHYTAASLALIYTISFIVLFFLSFAFLRREYLGLWQKAQEGSSRESSKRSYRPSSFVAVRGVMRALFFKELSVLARDGRGLLWAASVLLIWVLESASSHMLSRGLGVERVAPSEIPITVSALGFTIVLYFVAILVLRFVLPAFSAERRSMWMISSSPVDMGTVYAGKFVFFAPLLSAIALLFALYGAWDAGLLLPIGAPLAAATVIGTIFLVSLGLALGALYPNKETDDPEQLSTSLPGIGFIIIALLFGAWGAFALKSYFIASSLLPLSCFLFVSLAGALLLFVAAIERCRRAYLYD